jgi:exosortase/archaeosortase family protein
VNFARPAGAIPAGPLSLDLTIGRASLFACAGVLAALNAQADQIIGMLQYQSPVTAVSNLVGISAVIWFAMYAALRLGFEAEAERVSRSDAIALCAILLLSFLPISYAAKAALLLSGVYLLIRSEASTRARRVAYVLLALTGPLIWGRIVLLSFASPLLGLDAHIVGTVIGSSVVGNTVQFAGTAKRFLIGTGCSSVHNMSLALVLWTTAAALFDVRVDRRYAACGLLMVIVMYGLNIARLASIGLFPASFEFLHEGAGAELFGWAGLIGAGSLAVWGVSSAARRQR